ncbi:MAG: hypothetical protein K2J57_03180, partial [Bacteroidales bacterium]|nr:hypothetical protein [Bacteroidales bacterium]
MKKFLVNALLWAVAGILPISAAGMAQTSPAHEKIDLKGVKAVSVDGNFTVVLKQGPDAGMHISAPAEAMPKITVKQSKTSVDISIKGKL